ncbi:MAG: stage II sporulation protein P [Ruthenibacterium sp.]
MHRRRRPVLLPVLAGILCLATLGSAVFAAPVTSFGAGFAFLSTALCAPGAAFAATKEYIDASADVAAAQGSGAEDCDSGFWTQLPTQAELAVTAKTGDVPVDGPDTSDGANSADAPPDEPMPEGMVPLLSAHYDQGSGPSYLPCGAATLRNCTALSADELAAEIGAALPFSIEKNSAEPQVLLMHTHATECYEMQPHSWCDPAFSARSTDNALNMVAVGAQIAAQLNAAGISTVQDTTLHDYPSYNGSYAKSNATVRRYLAQHPSIKVVLDVHRDAIQKQDGTRIKPVAEIDGKTAAQVMIICGADKDGNLPNFKQNLRFASRWQAQMEAMYPGLTRPVLFDYRYYNQDLTTGSLLIEVGGHANTLDEAKYAGQLVGKALAALLSAG